MLRLDIAVLSRVTWIVLRVVSMEQVGQWANVKMFYGGNYNWMIFVSAASVLKIDGCCTVKE